MSTKGLANKRDKPSEDLAFDSRGDDSESPKINGSSLEPTILHMANA